MNIKLDIFMEAIALLTLGDRYKLEIILDRILLWS